MHIGLAPNQVARSERLSAPVCGAVLALLTVHGLLLVLSIPQNAVTYDEFCHLPVGISYWHRGEFWAYHHNPPLVRLIFAIPAVLLDVPIDYRDYSYVPGSRIAEYNLGRDFMQLNRNHYLQIYTLCRLVVAGISVLGGHMVFHWSRELFGDVGGLISLALWVFSPNVLAHAGLVTPDVGATVIGFAATYVFSRHLHRPSLLGVLLSGLLLGLSQAAKFSYIVLPVAWIVLAALKAYSSRKEIPASRTTHFSQNSIGESREDERTDNRDRVATPIAASLASRLTVLDIGGIFLISLLVLNDVYLWEGVNRPLGTFEFRSKTLTTAQFTGHDPVAQGSSARVNRFRGTFLETIPVPLPQHYVLGLDDQMFDVDSARCYAYLRGELRRGEGWWYYYVYCALVKSPLGSLFLIAAGAVAMLLARPCRSNVVSEAAMILPMLLFLLSVSSQTGLNAHFRYVLPAFPFAFVFVGRLGRLWTSRWRTCRIIVVVALAGNAVSVLRVHPHYLTYFNEAAGGPLCGLDHLADSNIDWGQGLIALRQWLLKNAPDEKIGFAYFGTMDPQVLGIDYELPSLDGPTPGVQAVSAYYLLGISGAPPNGQGSVTGVPPGAFVYFRRFEPIAIPGNSIYVYRLDAVEVNRVRAEMGMSLLADDPSSR